MIDLKTKKSILIIYAAVVAVLFLSIITLSILGAKERAGYFKISESDEQAIGNNRLEQIEYIYGLKIEYHNEKVFRNSDIYGVYINTNSLPDYVTSIKFDDSGSPFTSLTSSMKLENGRNIEDIGYTLKVKHSVRGWFSLSLLILLFLTYLFEKEVVIGIVNRFDNIVNKFTNKFSKFDNKITKTIAYVICLLFVNVFLGTVPFFLSPGRISWLMGFSQSFANNPSIFTIHASNIGYPIPAPMAFGLPVAYLASFFIRIGLLAVDANSFSYMIWFSIAFSGAFFFARKLTVSYWFSLLAGLCWMSMPFIRIHLGGYFALAVGFALLPIYILVGLCLFGFIEIKRKLIILLFPVVSLIAVFMDGYSFMMLVVASGVSALGAIMYRRKLLLLNFCILALSLGVSYILYTSFLGRSSYNFSIDFFRGWGLDLSFLLIPTRGIHLIPDLLGLSIRRVAANNFGDGSVRVTTFLFPITLIGVVSFVLFRKKPLAQVLFVIGVVAFYLALGPSVKFFSIRPEGLSSLMPAEYALFPTGSEFISKYIPGFSAMRAAYRWILLSAAAFWCLAVLCAQQKKYFKYIIISLIFVLAINYPSDINFISKYILARDRHISIDETLVADLQNNTKENEKAIFLPPANDFFINYLASKVNIITYNIGGDKNVDIARKNQPYLVVNSDRILDDNNIPALYDLYGYTDIVILPPFDTIWVEGSRWQIDDVKRKEIFEKYKKEHYEKFILEVKKDPRFVVEETDFATYIRLKDQFVENKNKNKNIYPFDISLDWWKDLTIASTTDGWYHLESTHVWSTEEASLNLPVPEDVKNDSSFLLDCSVFNASVENPIDIHISTIVNGEQWEDTIIATGNIEILIPIDTSVEMQRIDIEVPKATSPALLGISGDPRVLGIALRSISIKETDLEP